MTRDDAVAWLDSLGAGRIELGLDRIQRVLERLGHPERSYPCLHVAGTNGKGSTCAMAAAALQAAGLRVGFYSSPHLVRFEERIAIDGASIAGDELARGFERIRETAGEIPLTYFEAGTALAFLHFQGQVDVAVLETGLGGRLDATNVVTPVACAITTLGLDHTELLGPTLPDIAREKAGILKPGVPAAAAASAPEAVAVLEARAREVGVPLWLEGRDFEYRDGRYRGPGWSLDGAALSLRGPHQAHNAAVALALLELAALRGLSVTPAAAKRGLAATRWPGRFEVLEREGRTHVLDGAHNPQGAAALADALKTTFPGRTVRLVFGVLSDKDAASMIAALLPSAASVILVTPSSPRARPPAELLPLARRRCPEVSVGAGLPEAIEAARRQAAPDDLVVIAGSLYLLGEARALLG